MNPNDPNELKTPLLSHLIELRRRLIFSALFIIIAVGFCYFYSQEIFTILTQPLKTALGSSVKLSYFAPHEAFFSFMNLALYAGLAISFPFISLQIWLFVAPGLYNHEKNAALPFLFLAPVMFCAGAALAYFLIMPQALAFFAGFQSPLGASGVEIIQENRVSDYLSFAITFLFVFGISFELPVGLILAGKLGFVSADGLRRKRKYILLGAAIFSAAVTPPDLLSMTGLLIPLYGLFELSILIIALFERKKTIVKQ